MITANPVTNSSGQLVVTSSWGLGEAVVADLVVPDTFVLEESKGQWIVVEEDISSTKDVMVVYRECDSLIDRPGSAAAVTEQVPRNMQSSRSLEEHMLFQLADLGMLVKRAYLKMGHTYEHDIEWAFVKKSDGVHLYLLQTRPITTLKENKGRHEFDPDVESSDWV